MVTMPCTQKLAQVINSNFTIFLGYLIIPERSEGECTSEYKGCLLQCCLLLSASIVGPLPILALLGLSGRERLSEGHMVDMDQKRKKA